MAERGPNSASGKLVHRAHLRRRIGAVTILFLLDSLCWAFALVTSLLLRFDLDVPTDQWLPLVVVILWTGLVQLLIGWATFLYRGRHRHGTFGEVRTVFTSALITAAFVWLAVLLISPSTGIPRSLVPIALPIALVAMFAFRYFRRMFIEFRRGPSARAVPTLIYGAGYVGERITRRLMTDPTAGYWPVGLIEDDPEKRYVQFDRVKVRGTIDDLEQVACASGAKAILVAMGDPDRDLLVRVQGDAKRLGLEVKVMPPLDEMLRRGVRATDLRDLQIEDLLGRPPLDTEIDAVAGYLTGKRVLVTGAGGSIGSELCVQIMRFNPRELIMLDRDETALQHAQLSVQGHGLLDSRDVVLADIREAERIKSIFLDRRPDVVFHAAALKHLPMLQQYPDQGWKTNVLGTLNVLLAAEAAQVSTLINVSTDKAANPTSVLGHSKQLAERLTAHLGARTGNRYISVRFGNVIGSRGSMLPTFTRLIEQGGPLTVTHPDVTRFFMTIPEACQLVIQAGGIGQTGEVLILDMGEPVRILDIAERMISISGREDVDIVFTGLRPGEKLHEELVGDRESPSRPLHPKISHAQVLPIAPESLDYERWIDAVCGEEVTTPHATLVAATGRERSQ